MIQNNDDKELIIHLLNKTMNIEIKELIFKKIEKFKGIEEYDFYLINLTGITKEGKEQEIFIKNIKKGKIKESLFCICDLAYEKYFDYKKNSKEYSRRLKKISIIENRSNKKNISEVYVKLFEDNLKKIKVNIEIYFIEMSKIINKDNKKGRIKNIEIEPNDIIILGTEHKCGNRT